MTSLNVYIPGFITKQCISGRWIMHPIFRICQNTGIDYTEHSAVKYINIQVIDSYPLRKNEEHPPTLFHALARSTVHAACPRMYWNLY